MRKAAGDFSSLRASRRGGGAGSEAVRAARPYAKPEAYEIAERDVGAGVLEVNQVKVCGWAEEPVAGLEIQVAGHSVRVGGWNAAR